LSLFKGGVCAVYRYFIGAVFQNIVAKYSGAIRKYLLRIF